MSVQAPLIGLTPEKGAVTGRLSAGPVASVAPPRISNAPCCAGSSATEKSSGNTSGRSAAFVYMHASSPFTTAPPSVTSAFPAATLLATRTSTSKPVPCAAAVPTPALCMAAVRVLTTLASVPEKYRVTDLFRLVKLQVAPPPFPPRAAMGATTRLVAVGLTGDLASPQAATPAARRRIHTRRLRVIGTSGAKGSDECLTRLPQDSAR